MLAKKSTNHWLFTSGQHYITTRDCLGRINAGGHLELMGGSCPLCPLVPTLLSIKLLAYDIYSFPGQGLFSSAQTFLSFVPLTFVSSKSAFLHSLINTRVLASSFKHLELSM